MKDLYYTPMTMYMRIDDRRRHSLHLSDFSRVPIVAHTLNNKGDMLYLYKKKNTDGSNGLINTEKPLYILQDISFEELVRTRHLYLWAHVKEVTILEGNKSYKNTLMKPEVE